MIVTLHRIKQDQYGTHGMIEDAEGNVICSTIERPWLNNAHGVSCVPDGDYPCEPHIKSNNGQHCWELQNVPDRTGILIHTGNTEGDSEGCIIVGLTSDAQGVGQSQAALDLLHQKLPSTFTLKIVSTFNLHRRNYMTNVIEKGLEALEIDFKEFWDNVALPDIRKGEQIALNIAKELEPLAEEAGQAIFGAGIAAMSVASNGVIPADGAAAMKLLSVGVDAALAKASVLRVQLSPQVVTTVLSGLSIPAPKVANGVNG